ncbi:DUF6602 domain-containing protein [Psychrobacter glaciei]|uniref:DUF6602 domain-containing protein n=1 Tax=Psychrobacter glaciei TaxID=619771 RepID=UPI003F48343A
MTKSSVKSRPIEPNPIYLSKFEEAMYRFVGTFISSNNINHSLTKGEEREIPIKDFLLKALPSNFEVKPGEIIDCLNNSSPQLDIMIYDKFKTIEFYNSDAAVIPAESLLVSIEIKSKLNKQETKKILENARKLKQLRPFKTNLNLKNLPRGHKAHHCRYFHCVFAYDTDFTKSDWAKAEYDRFKQVGKENNIDFKLIDRIFVMNKGLINPPSERGINEKNGEVLTFMYFISHILNFAIRENERRKPVPYERYSGRESKCWKSLE